MKKNSVLPFSFLYVFLSIVTIVILLPFYWGLMTSFRQPSEVFNPTLLLLHPSWVNYSQLLTETFFPRWFFNSCLIASCYTGIGLFFCSLGGYAFAKYSFKGKNVLFLITLGSLMIPVWTVIVPLYTLFAKINALNKYWILIVPGSAHPLGIFMMRQYIHGIPSEIIDSARIDGCSEFRIYYSIILPVIKPALGALAIILFMFSWNNFLLPLILMNKKTMFTVPVGLTSFIGQWTQMFGPLIAGTFVSVIPVAVIFVRMQKELVSGLTIGAVKG